ncbi:pectin lyase fold/virulence factor [Auriculariales sp. MPI-PUGE-AT-0066]|nr:pectin lyase fold/virulence factor [Auriculariales sp. MPI-PUGE-AT-0066]
MRLLSTLVTTAAALLAIAQAQLTGRVGPLTTAAQKAAIKTCNVLNYGGKADNTTDVSGPLYNAWLDCRDGGLVYIPPGNYVMDSWINLRSGNAAGVQLDGIIYRRGTDGGTMITIRGCNDFEFFSGTSKGAIQGGGWEFLKDDLYGPRFIRVEQTHSFSMHGFALVDSPAYYTVFDDVSDGEIYNIIMRGITVGMTDGVDLAGSNVWVHDIEITNGDECVTVKSGSSNLLIESIHCNISGGNAIGSLGTGTSISDVLYRNIYCNQADPAYLKTNNGSGTVKNIMWDNVIVHGGAYVLALNEGWGEDRGSTGVQLTNLTFKNWWGYNSNNSRAVIRLECDPDVPCTGITLSNINLWTNAAGATNVKWTCQSAFGSGACLRKTPATSYAYSATTVSTAPATWSTVRMPNDHSSAFPRTKFTIPPIPTTFFPGLKPFSKLLSISGPGGLNKEVGEAREVEPTAIIAENRMHLTDVPAPISVPDFPVATLTTF